VPTYQAFASTDLLGQLALERMLAKLSCRRYQAGLEPVGAEVERVAAGTSRSAVSPPVRRPNRARPGRAARPGSVRAGPGRLMVDGIRVAEHTCVVALGITIDGRQGAPPRGAGRARPSRHPTLSAP
jgi:putative transposase